MLRLISYGRCIQADISWQIYYGRFITADILRITKTAIYRPMYNARISRLLHPDRIVAMHHPSDPRDTLHAHWALVGWAIVGPPGPSWAPWALVGHEIVGRPLWASWAVLGPPWPLWAGLLWAPLGPCGLGHLGTHGPSWAVP